MNKLTIRVVFLAVASLLVAGCVRVDPSAPARPTVGGLETDQALAIVIDTSGSFESDWEGKAYPFLLKLMEDYFHQSLGTQSVLQLAVLSEQGEPVFWEAPPREFQRVFPDERSFLEGLATAKQTERSPIFRSVTATIESVQAVPGLADDAKVTVVVLSDLQDNTQPRGDAKAEGGRMITAIKAFVGDGGNIAFYYCDPKLARSFSGALRRAHVDGERYWIESTNAFAPTPPNFY